MNLLETNYQEIITTFVLNTMLHHVGMIWMIENHEDLKYDMEIQNSYWRTGGPWYNTYMCKKLNGQLFEGFIINSRTDRYNIMCSIDAYERENQSSSCDDGRSSVGFPLPTNSTTAALGLLVATIYFIGCWLKSLEHNFIERCHMYTHFMKELFQKIPVELPNQPIPKEKRKSLLRAIGGGW